jgi:hypothetical protein
MDVRISRDFTGFHGFFTDMCLKLVIQIMILHVYNDLMELIWECKNRFLRILNPILVEFFNDLHRMQACLKRF